MCLYPGGGSGVSLGSTDLLKYIDPLPMDQLLYHEAQAVLVTVTLTREFV